MHINGLPRVGPLGDAYFPSQLTLKICGSYSIWHNYSNYITFKRLTLFQSDGLIRVFMLLSDALFETNHSASCFTIASFTVAKLREIDPIRQEGVFQRWRIVIDSCLRIERRKHWKVAFLVLMSTRELGVLPWRYFHNERLLQLTPFGCSNRRSHRANRQERSRTRAPLDPETISSQHLDEVA